MSLRPITLGGLALLALLAHPGRIARAAPPADHSATWDGVVGPSPAPAPTPAPAAIPPRVPNLEDARDLLRNDPELAPRYRRGRGMIIGGGVSLGAGASLLVVALLVGTTTAAFSTGDPDDGYEIDWTPTIVLAGSGAVFTGVGAALVAIGSRERKAAVQEARRRVGLSLGPQGLALRF